MQYDLFKGKMNKQDISQYITSKIRSNNIKEIYSDLFNAANILKCLIKYESVEQSYFFSNYEALINLLHEYAENQAISLTLHWLNIYGQRLIEINKAKEAKQIYQEFLHFTHNKSVDRLLLFTGLNNLCILEKSQKNYHECLQHSLQNIKMISDEMKVLKNKHISKKDQFFFNLAVILVNSFKTSKDCIQKILMKQKKSNFQQQKYFDLLQDMKYYGYKACSIYLGKQSHFFKFFDLPKYEESKSSIIQSKDLQIMPNEYQQLSDLIQKVNKNLIIDEEIVQENKWKISIKLNRSQTQKIGTLKFTSQNYEHQQKRKYKIQEEKLNKIINLLNLEDVLPYEYSLDNLPSEKFISLCILPFLGIKMDGNIQILSKSKGIFKECMITYFFQYQCLISLNQIKGNKFRLSVSPMESSGSLYLNISFSQDSIRHFFCQLNEQIPQKIIKQFFSLSKVKEQFNQKTNKNKILVKNKQVFEEYLKTILKQYEQFLRNQDQGYGDLLSLIEDNEIYFKFTQISKGKGSFFRIYFMHNICTFNIYAQSAFIKSKNLSIANRVKGQTMFTKDQFFDTFGIQMSSELIKMYLKRFCQIISDKYFLNDLKNISIIDQKSYLSSSYCDNFILERTFNFHCFQVQFINQLNNYLSPVTVSIVTINNQVPIGIKVSHYDPDTINSKGYYIDLRHQDWLMINFNKKQKQIIQFNNFKNAISKQEPSLLKKSEEEYPFMKNYYIGLWMQFKGFNKLLNCAINENSKLYIHKNMNKIVNWRQIIQD